MLRGFLFLVALLAVLGATGCGATPPPSPTPTTSGSVSPVATVSTPAPLPTASATATPGIATVTLLGDAAVIQASDLGDGHYSAILPAVYFIADGIRHAYVVGFGEAIGDQRVFHVSSRDEGANWTVDSADPFARLGLDTSPPGPVPGSVLSADDGSWQMYLWAYPASVRDASALYRATAPAPQGPWTANPEPVVPVGEIGDWDSRALDFPAVVRDDDGYLMLYGAVGGQHPNEARIGLAHSSDGITWQKDGLVIEPSVCDGSDSDFIALPRLAWIGDHFVVLFLLGDELGAASSTDGREWTCIEPFPLLSSDDIPNSDRIHTISAAVDGAGFSMLIESLFTRQVGGVASELWLAEASGF